MLPDDGGGVNVSGAVLDCLGNRGSESLLGFIIHISKIKYKIHVYWELRQDSTFYLVVWKDLDEEV